MNLALVLLVAVPLVAGLGMLILGHRADPWAPEVGLAAATAALVLAVTVTVGRPTVSVPLLAGIRAGIAVDGLSAVMVLTVTAITLAVLVYAAGEFARHEARARFFGLMLIFSSAMLLTVTATDLVVLLGAWEVMGAMSYALIGFWWTEPHRVHSATLAFLTTRTADLGMYLAAGAALAGGVGTLSLAALSGARGPWLAVVTAGLVLAAIGKSAQLPFSFWLSRAMDGPSPVSALLHSATMVAAGGYLLLRLHPLLAATSWAGPTVAWIGVATAVLLGVVALAQSDLKQLLAASTCSQVGFIVLAAGVSAEGVSGVGGGTLQLVAHAATKSLLFLGAGAWLHALGTKDLTALAGVARRYPVVGATFTVGALTLAGVPPLSIWVGKDEVLAAARQQSAALYAVGLAAALFSALYAGKALMAVWGHAPGRPVYDTEQRGTRHVSALMNAPLPALAVAAASIGVLVLPQVPVFREAVGSAGDVTPDAAELTVSGVLAVAGVAVMLGWRRAPWRVPEPVLRWWAGWLGLEWLARRGIVVPTMYLAHALARFDDRVLDQGVDRVGGLGRLLARLSSVRLEVGLDDAVRAIAAGTRRAGTLARRPQTGQLHQYYAQAIAGLVLLALVLAVVR